MIYRYIGWFSVCFEQRGGYFQSFKMILIDQKTLREPTNETKIWLLVEKYQPQLIRQIFDKNWFFYVKSPYKPS